MDDHSSHDGNPDDPCSVAAAITSPLSPSGGLTGQADSGVMATAPELLALQSVPVMSSSLTIAAPTSHATPIFSLPFISTALWYHGDPTEVVCFRRFHDLGVLMLRNMSPWAKAERSLASIFPAERGFFRLPSGRLRFNGSSGSAPRQASMIANEASTV